MHLSSIANIANSSHSPTNNACKKRQNSAVLGGNRKYGKSTSRYFLRNIIVNSDAPKAGSIIFLYGFPPLVIFQAKTEGLFFASLQSMRRLQCAVVSKILMLRAFHQVLVFLFCSSNWEMDVMRVFLRPLICTTSHLVPSRPITPEAGFPLPHIYIFGRPFIDYGSEAIKSNSVTQRKLKSRNEVSVAKCTFFKLFSVLCSSHSFISLRQIMLEKTINIKIGCLGFCHVVKWGYMRWGLVLVAKDSISSSSCKIHALNRCLHIVKYLLLF